MSHCQCLSSFFLQIPFLLGIKWHHAVIRNSIRASHSFVRPQNVWRRTCTSQFSLSTDPRHLSEGEDPRLSDKMLHPGTFTKEIWKWCQKYSMQAPDSLHKWGYYYYTTIIYLQPNRNIPRRGVGVLLVVFWTQKASHYVSNDLICMHCPLQICVTVGLPHPPKQVCCASNYHILI